MIGIVNYGKGNLLSVCNALEMTGTESNIYSRPEELREMSRAALPEVSASDRLILNGVDKVNVNTAGEKIRREHGALWF